jgi:hypothetical protein
VDQEPTREVEDQEVRVGQDQAGDCTAVDLEILLLDHQRELEHLEPLELFGRAILELRAHSHQQIQVTFNHAMLY